MNQHVLYLEERVRTNISDVRAGTYHNLWLLIDSLKNLSDPNVQAGFHTWNGDIGNALAEETCKEIGQRICEELGFTIEEGERLMSGPYRESEAKKYNLPSNATWEEIRKAESIALRKHLEKMQRE